MRASHSVAEPSAGYCQVDRQYSETGGRGYDSFVGDGRTERVEQDVVMACFNCHLRA